MVGYHQFNLVCSFFQQVLQNILETETEYSKELQNLLTNYLRPLQNTDKWVLIKWIMSIPTFPEVTERNHFSK